MTKTISFRPTEQDVKAIEFLKSKLFSTKDSQAIHYALSRALIGGDVELSPANASVEKGVFTPLQEEMLAEFRKTTGFTSEKVIEDMFGSYFESLYHEDRPKVTRETPSALSPEKKADLEGLRRMLNKEVAGPIPDGPLGGVGIFDQKSGEVITDPEEAEARNFSQDDLSS